MAITKAEYDDRLDFLWRSIETASRRVCTSAMVGQCNDVRAPAG